MRWILLLFFPSIFCLNWRERINNAVSYCCGSASDCCHKSLKNEKNARNCTDKWAEQADCIEQQLHGQYTLRNTRVDHCCSLFPMETCRDKCRQLMAERRLNVTMRIKLLSEKCAIAPTNHTLMRFRRHAPFGDVIKRSTHENSPHVAALENIIRDSASSKLDPAHLDNDVISCIDRMEIRRHFCVSTCFLYQVGNFPNNNRLFDFSNISHCPVIKGIAGDEPCIGEEVRV